MPDLTCLSANVHNSPAAVARLDGLRFDVGLLCEVNHVGRELVGIGGYRYLTGILPGPSRETGILLTRRLRRLVLRGFTTRFLSPAAPKFKAVGKERWGQVALVDVDGVAVACITLHPVAGPAALSGNDPSHRLVRLYAKAMRWLEAEVSAHVAAGHEVILGSDIQMFEGWDRPWSPRHIFAEHRMATYWQRIDVIAWTPGLVRVKASTHDIGSDHPALRVAFDVKPNRRKQ